MARRNIFRWSPPSFIILDILSKVTQCDDFILIKSGVKLSISNAISRQNKNG